MTEHSEKTSTAQGSFAFRFTVAGMVFLFPILYAASIGPVCRLQSLGWLSETMEMVLTCFYLPIAFAVENSPFVASVFEVYVDWWNP